MLNISYKGSPGLSLAILAPFRSLLKCEPQAEMAKIQ